MKVLKFIGIVLLVVVLLIAAGIAFIVYKFATTPPEIMAPEDYETSVETGGAIEAKYISHGAFETGYFEEETDEVFQKYEVYYPTALETGSEKYPVIVSANGSGVRASRYPALLEHYASWGFIVIGNEHDTSFAGDSTDACLAYLIAQNKNPDSVLYQRVDLENVGVVGHSQGGVGVFNAITAQPHSSVYKAAVSLSPVPVESAKAINWTYEPGKVTISIMVLAGTENDTIDLEPMQQLYSLVNSDKVMARRSNTNHPEMLYSADGYVTAWFMWHLQGDEEAAKAFVGDDAEILTNPLYQDQQIVVK